MRHADFAGAIGAFTTSIAVTTGDARGSSANSLTGEFLGDYDYAFATNAYVVAVWNDVRNAADCPAVDAYRQESHDGDTAGDASDPDATRAEQRCPPTFGNSDIFGGSYADPTP